MKTLLLSFILALLSFQLNAQAPSSNDPLKKSSKVFHTPTLGSALQGLDMKTILENFNPDKIVQVQMNFGLKIFSVDYTPQFNVIETLGLFREFGLEAYFIDNGNKYVLDQLGSGLVVTPFDPTEE